MTVNTLDWIFLSVLGLSLLVGAWRGLMFELLSLIGWVAAFFAAQYFAHDMGALLPLDGINPTWRYLAGFGLVFVAAVFASGLLAWGVKKLVEAARLRPADRALGALFGALRGLVLLLVTAQVAAGTPMAQAPQWQQSQGVQWLEAVRNTAASILSGKLEK